MSAGYKAYRVRIQLECGHIVTCKVEYPHRVPEEYQHCPSCGYRVAIWAIECREWRAKCMKCKYTRWCGQAMESANKVADAHYFSKQHLMNVRYGINPETFVIVKKFGTYVGRGFRFRIENDDGKKKVPWPRRIMDTPDEPEF